MNELHTGAESMTPEVASQEVENTEVQNETSQKDENVDPRVWELSDEKPEVVLGMHEGHNMILKKSNRSFDYVKVENANLWGWVYIVELKDTGRVIDPHRNFDERPSKQQIEEAMQQVKEEFDREEKNKWFFSKAKFW